MNYLKDFIDVQFTAIKNTFKHFRYILIVAFAIIAGSLVMNVVTNLLSGLITAGGLSLVVGTLIYLLEIFILSIIMSILIVAVKENTSFSGFISSTNTQLFFKLVQIGFIFYIAEIILRITGLSRVYMILSPLILIVFNALPETIYLEEYDGMGTITKSLDFLKNNIINWGISNILIFVLFYFLKINYILPFTLRLGTDFKTVAMAFIQVVIYSIFLIYRGNLFETLNGSSMRKREYMRKFDNE